MNSVIKCNKAPFNFCDETNYALINRFFMTIVFSPDNLPI